MIVALVGASVGDMDVGAGVTVDRRAAAIAIGVAVGAAKFGEIVTANPLSGVAVRIAAGLAGVVVAATEVTATGLSGPGVTVEPRAPMNVADGVGDGPGVGESVTVGDGDGVGVGVRVAVAVGVGVGVGVAVGPLPLEGAVVAVAVRAGVCDGVGVRVPSVPASTPTGGSSSLGGEVLMTTNRYQ